MELGPSKKIYQLSAKPISIQILIVFIWVIAAILAVYYVTYEQMTFELIRANILPEDLTFVLILSGALVIMGIILLFASHPKNSTI